MARRAKMSKTMSAVTSTFRNVSLRTGSKPSTEDSVSTNPYSLLGEQVQVSKASLKLPEDADNRSETLGLTASSSKDDAAPTKDGLGSGREDDENGERDWNVVLRTKNRNTRYEVTNPMPVNVLELDNWRNGDIGPSASGYHEPRGNGARKSRVFLNGSKFPNLKGPRTLGGVLLEDIKPGTVMWRYDNRLCSDPTIKDSDAGLFYGPGGEKWHRKGRYWVVIYRCRDHVMELPIYTFNNAGLARKPEKLKDTYSSVQPPNASSFVNQNPDQMVLEMAYALNEHENFRGTMVVHCNEIWSHTNEVLEARIAGQLTVDSTNELMRRARSFIGTVTDD